jgi:NAD(P)-dependent dehydrogenase (short-subunit alcohol dehydrogenase family)
LPKQNHDTSKSEARGYFRDRVVLVTGASSGIGRDVALRFSEMGAKVAVLARRKPLLDELAHEIESHGGSALVLPADVTKRAEAYEAVERTLRDFGRIDVLVNSAGIMTPDPVESMKPRDLERMMAVNLLGTLHAMQAVLPSMRGAGSGNIVNIGSLAGRRGMTPLGGYAASKFALVGLTQALRIELFRSGVKASLVMPGVVDTELGRAKSGDVPPSPGLAQAMTAMPVRWVTWAVIAAVVLGLAEVDVPPGAAVAEKLASLFPGLTDAVLALGTQFVEWIGKRG